MFIIKYTVTDMIFNEVFSEKYVIFCLYFSRFLQYYHAVKQTVVILYGMSWRNSPPQRWGSIILFYQVCSLKCLFSYKVTHMSWIDWTPGENSTFLQRDFLIFLNEFSPPNILFFCHLNLTFAQNHYLFGRVDTLWVNVRSLNPTRAIIKAV